MYNKRKRGLYLMTKSNLAAVMKREYKKGISKYNKLWDALNYLYHMGLITESEREIIKQINHDLPKNQ